MHIQTHRDGALQTSAVCTVQLLWPGSPFGTLSLFRQPEKAKILTPACVESCRRAFQWTTCYSKKHLPSSWREQQSPLQGAPDGELPPGDAPSWANAWPSLQSSHPTISGSARCSPEPQKCTGERSPCPGCGEGCPSRWERVCPRQELLWR